MITKERERAHYLLNRAIELGDIVRPELCQKCGGVSPDRALDGHHPDYSKPLDVEWLCRTCHMRTHYQTSSEESVLVAVKMDAKLAVAIKHHCAKQGITIRSFFTAALMEATNA